MGDPSGPEAVAATREVLFGEAVRVFCDHLSDPDARLASAEAVGRIFQYSGEQVAYHVNERSPLVHSDGSVLTVGRNRLPIASTDRDLFTSRACFIELGFRYDLVDLLLISGQVYAILIQNPAFA